MVAYWIIVVIAIIIMFFLVIAIKRLINKDSSTDVSVSLIITGISLIASAFQGTKEVIVAIVASLFCVSVETTTDYVAIVCGFALIGLGLYYKHLIKEMIFVLNIFGLFAQPEISDACHMKELNLADFKVKESIIDFVDIFQYRDMSTDKNTVIVKKIKKQCEAFRDKSSDTKACFTGMAPVPYTILAGNYLSGGSIKRYFEYNGATQKFAELDKKKRFKNHRYSKLIVKYQDNLNEKSSDIVVAVSITFPIQDADINQFDLDVLRIDLNEPKNNIVTSVDQLEEYCDTIITEIEGARLKYSNLKTVHLLASIPSCVSVLLGEQFCLRSNRLPKIIAYHFMNSNRPKYPFGIVVADSDKNCCGKLIQYDEWRKSDV